MTAPISEDRFTRDLRASQPAVWRVARWLGDRGHDITIPAVRIRPTYAEAGAYTDTSDLILGLRMEVKHRQLAFTSAADYPYPTVIVDSKESYDKKIVKPTGYFLLNATSTHVAYVGTRTFAEWLVAAHVAHGEGRRAPMADFYECPVALVLFYALPIK